MRVLHIITRFAEGGSERDVLNLIRWEQSRGMDVAVLTGGRSAEAQIAPGVLQMSAAALVPELNPLQDLRAFGQLRATTRKFAPDLVFTHQSKAGVLGRLAARGVPALIHMIHMASFGPGYSKNASRMQALSERYCAGFTNGIVSVGEELRARYLAAGIGRPEQYSLVRTPIDLDAFADYRGLTAAQRTEIRTDFRVLPERPLLVAIGALEPRKRHFLLIEQLRPLLERGTVSLAIAGEGPERARLTGLIQKYGLEKSVTLIGSTRRVPELLASADAMLLASLVEGVPRVLIESLAAGTPVIATDVEGLREVPGAPITILPRDGSGFEAAVQVLVDSPPAAPVPLAALDAWRPGTIDGQIERIFEQFAPSMVAGARR